jgi:hypothetical protein
MHSDNSGNHLGLFSSWHRCRNVAYCQCAGDESRASNRSAHRPGPVGKPNWTLVQIESLTGPAKLLNCLRGISRNVRDNPGPARRY